MKNFVFVCFLGLLATACTKNREIKLTAFTEIPHELQGCICYFSKTEKDLDARNYVFVSDLEANAFVALNGKLTQLKLLKTSQQQNRFGNYDYKNIYTNDSLQITVDIKYKATIVAEESWSNTGTITVKHENGETTTQSFEGECGC